MKENKADYLVWIIFLCIGGFFLLFGGIICAKIFNYDDKVETTGRIIEISYHNGHDVYVSYKVEGEEYVSRLGGYSSSYYEGMKIDIYYDRDNPNKIGTKSLDRLFLMFPGFGILFSMLGGIGIIVKINKKNSDAKLKETGKVIYGNYVETVVNTSYSVNGVFPYNIICEWNNPQDNKKYIFKSKNLWIYPDDVIYEKNIQYFPIYIDENNMKKYVIDTDAITADVVDLR